MAWSIVGVGTIATPVTATPLTLTEPAGVADGDLLVACIASRTTATTAVTSTGWTAVNSQNNNNTLTTGSALASGTMLYRVRSGTPTLNFTLPAGISVAMGCIVAYRGNAAATPVDVSTAVTTATSTTAVSVTGLTTTQADDLIVAMAAGGQEAAWSSFNATTPSGASGATDTTTAPSATWRERADSVTTTGADTSLGVFDALKTAAGATGNLTATASVAAGHVVIAGAFKIQGTLDAWNDADASGNITLTNSDKTAAVSTAVAGAVRSTTTHLNGTAGKYYAEIVLDAVSIGVTTRIGITPLSNALTAITSNFYLRLPIRDIYVNSVDVGDFNAVSAGTVVCIAWDAGAEQVWFRNNATSWNQSGSADPATNTGGYDCSFAASTEHALWIYSPDPVPVFTIRTELAEFTQSIPYGFTSWMAEMPSIADAWNANDKSAIITLSNNDKTATTTSGAGVGVRSTTTHLHGTAGKYYAEFLCSNIGTGGNVRIGVGTLTDTLTNSLVGLDTNINSASIFRNNANVGSVGSAFTAGDVLCFAWDTSAELFWFRKNGGSWNNDGSANPVTGVNGISSSVTVDTAHALKMTSTSSGAAITICTELAEFTQTVPSGFTSWMGETPAAAATSLFPIDPAAFVPFLVR